MNEHVNLSPDEMYSLGDFHIFLTEQGELRVGTPVVRNVLMVQPKADNALLVHAVERKN